VKAASQSESRIARYEQKSREGEVGSREEKGRKSDGMRAKGRAASFKVGPSAPSSRAGLHLRAKRPFRATNHLPTPPSIILNLWNVHLDPRSNQHANRDKLRGNRKRTRKPRKSERAKIESFILCPMFLVPRNAKQRRGNCHNPIFTHGIFSGAGTQGGATRIQPA
jgi:hypothetical protein